jgi:molybdopterin-guanine dinucleotide biosynthesis protein A
MGVPKAHLPFGNATLIETVVATLRPVFKTVYVVGRDRERLVDLGATLLIDDRDEQGPLVGLARGLSASHAPWCFVVGCDMPFLSPRVIRRMASSLDDCDVLAAYVEGRTQSLHAFYSIGCLPTALGLLDKGNTSLKALLAACKLHSIDGSDFLDLDPELTSFMDLDTEEEYRAARQIVERVGALEPAP